MAQWSCIRALAKVLVALAIVAAPAKPSFADTDAEADSDPRALFGLGPKTDTTKEADCSAGRSEACVGATDAIDDDAPLALRTRLYPWRRWPLPLSEASVDVLASLAPGMGRDATGVNGGGASGLDTRWTLGGAPFDSVRTGALELRLPALFVQEVDIRAGGFTAADRIGFGPGIDLVLLDGADVESVRVRTSASLAGAGSARLFATAPGEFFPLTGRSTPARLVSAAAAMRGPLPAPHRLVDRAWYAASLSATGFDAGFVRTAQRLVDGDQDGNADRDGSQLQTEVIDTTKLSALGLSLPFMARVGARRGVHRLDVDVVGGFGQTTRFDPLATTTASGVGSLSIVAHGVARWKARWANTRVRALAAWGLTRTYESPRRGSANTAQTLLAGIPPPSALEEEPDIAQGCDDTPESDAYPSITNCPVRVGWFARDGAGLLFDRATDRPVLRADLDHRIGASVIRIGGVAEDARLVESQRYTGGVQVRSLFPGHTDELRLAQADANGEVCDNETGVRCREIGTAHRRYRTRHLGAYLQHDWRLLSNWVVSTGLRWESAQLGSQLHFSRQFAPRAGFAWDPGGRGKSRVFASWGRAFLPLPAGVGPRSNGPLPTVRDISSPFGQTRVFDPGAGLATDSELAPPFSDSLSAGAIATLVDGFYVATWGEKRWVRRALEDDGFALGNPALVEPPRETSTVAVELTTGGDPLWLRAAYTFTHVRGTWLGAFDPSAGSVLYIGPDFNDSTSNLGGVLPGDGHRLLAEAIVRGGKRVPWTIALRGQLASGRPISALSPGPRGRIHLLPRGSVGRLGHTSALAIAGTVRIASFDVFAEVSNAFAHDDTTAVREFYADEGPRPIAGGDLTDLVFLKVEVEGEGEDATATPATRNPAFGHPTEAQPPIAAAVGVRAEF